MMMAGTIQASEGCDVQSQLHNHYILQAQLKEAAAELDALKAATRTDECAKRKRESYSLIIGASWCCSICCEVLLGAIFATLVFRLCMPTTCASEELLASVRNRMFHGEYSKQSYLFVYQT